MLQVQRLDNQILKSNHYNLTEAIDLGILIQEQMVYMQDL